MNLGLSLNPRQEKALALAQDLQRHLRGRAHVVVEPPFGTKLGLPEKPLEAMEVDVIVCIGGDGTILRALQKTMVPILGINTSIVGFLTEVAPDEMGTALQRLLSGQYTLEERLKISVHLDGRRLPDVANEVLIHGSQIGHLRHFHLRVDGQLASDLNADGLVVSTPTGSTGYSLSAGGPLVDPRAAAFVITAIAPFKLTHRPLVVPASAEVRIALARPMACVLVLDGQQEIPMQGGEELKLGTSEAKARFVHFRFDFYERVNEKLALKQGLKFHGPPEEKSSGH